MDLSTHTPTPDVPLSIPPTLTPFLEKISAQLSTDGGHLFWNSDGKGFSFNRHVLERFLKSEANSFAEKSVELFIIQLRDHGFYAITAESNDRRVDDDDTFLAFQNDNFIRESAESKPTKPIYCSRERNYLRNKRANDPCYKLIANRRCSSKHQLAYEVSKQRFRALLNQQKLKTILAARLTAGAEKGAEIYRDLLPNETNISIQMGAIAGYYGETVVEDELIDFFGKLLPMYKPITEVVDGLTPSVSNKIQSTNYLWGNNKNKSTDAESQQPAAIVTPIGSGQVVNHHRSAEETVTINPVKDITFEYVSFQEEMAAAMAKGTLHPELPSSSALIPDNAIGIVKLRGQGITASQSKPIIVQQQHLGAPPQSNEFVPIINPGDCDEINQMDVDPEGYNLLSSNYYDSSTIEFATELKNAIDMIME